ncbi:MAG: ABC transporter ATP-binding protein [Lachnospiraceae bacterium]|nr:ABC transporter ATP-binding protein [Lachnospiraceae bacterium]
MFEINNLSKSYGDKPVLDNISLKAYPGDSIGVLGVNGSGKSTLLSCIAKIYAGLSKQDSSYARVAYVPQENPLFDELNAVDNMKMWTKLSRAQILEALSKPPLSDMGILDFANKPVRKMSGGMKKRVSIAIALLDKPDILLLDEPLAALDLPAKEDVLHIMKQFTDNRHIIIVASHDKEIFDFCNAVYLLKDGTLTDAKSVLERGLSYTDILRS